MENDILQKDRCLLDAISAVKMLQNNTSAEHFSTLAIEHSKKIRKVESLFSINIITHNRAANPNSILQILRGERYKLHLFAKKMKLNIELPLETDL